MFPQQIPIAPQPTLAPQNQFCPQMVNQETQQQYFGLILPGFLPITEFQQVNDMLVYDLQNPGSVAQITFYQLQQIPDDFAGVLYYSIPPFQDLSFIGAIANPRPSDIFNTSFGLNPNINQCASIKLIIKAEPISNNQNLKLLVELTQTNDIQKEYAKKVAQNLYNFMVSFHKEGLIGGQEGYLVIPEDFLERWYSKFEQKYKFDPNFIMKTQLN